MIGTLRIAVAVLVVIGVAAALGRTVYRNDFVTRMEPVRRGAMEALHRNDPFASSREAELAKVDGKFAARPGLTLLHVLAGGIFLLFAPLQFSSRLRTRNLRLHRWSGRILLPAVIASALPGMYFGLVAPYGGPSEAVAIAALGSFLLFAAVRAFVAIRRGQVARHREWMIRVFALALAIATVRLVGIPLDLALTPAGLSPAVLFSVAIWTGWLSTLAVAELWIRHTRTHWKAP